MYNNYEARDSIHNPSDASRAERVCDKRDTSFRVTEAWSPQRDREARQVQTYRGAYLHLLEGSSKRPRWPRFKPSTAPLHANPVTQTQFAADSHIYGITTVAGVRHTCGFFLLLSVVGGIVGEVGIGKAKVCACVCVCVCVCAVSYTHLTLPTRSTV